MASSKMFTTLFVVLSHKAKVLLNGHRQILFISQQVLPKGTIILYLYSNLIDNYQGKYYDESVQSVTYVLNDV